MPPRKTLEEELLDNLWGEGTQTGEQPLLYGSKVIQQSQARPTYQELAASGNPLSALVPAATVQLDAPSTATRGVTATVLSKALSATAQSPKRTQRAPPGSLRAGIEQVTARGAEATGLDGSVLVDAATLRAEVDSVVSAVEARRRECEDAALALEKAEQLAATMQAEVQSLSEEAIALDGATPPAPERLKKVRTWLDERSAALSAQQAMVNVLSLEAATAEAALRTAEAEVDFLTDTRQALDAAFASDEGTRREIMQALRGREERAAQGYLGRLKREAQRLEELKAQQEELIEQKINAAEDARAAAMERLTKGLERVNRNLTKGQELVEAQRAARRQALLGLKESLGKVREEVARKAGLYQQVQKQKREMLEREFADLIEQGLNPYEVHRRKDMQTQAAKQRASLRARIEARQVEVAAKLAKEEELYQKQLEAQAEEKKMAAKFQKEQGRAASEAKIDQYMMTHTVTGQAMLDPTGRLPVDPSLATVAKTRDFGAGRATQALLEKMTLKHPHVAPKDMLLPTKYRPERDSEDEDDDLSSEEEGGAKSRAYTERTTHTMATSAAVSHRSGDAANGGAGDNAGWQQQGKGTWNPFERKPLTKLEAATMEAAKARHKEALAAPKVMMGKSFSGDAFLPTPSIVVFKDFDVGSTYTAKVTITNRSYAKNTYRVLEVPPEYGNVLEVSYQLPGHLATGVSGEISVTFTPKSNEDINTAIRMLAETGPFEIPVRCLTKKACLSLSTPSLDFGPGVTLGEHSTRYITLSNQGALDVEYCISEEDSNDTRSSDRTDTGSPGGPLSTPPFTLTPSQGTVSGYSHIKLTVTYKPTAAETTSRKLVVSYKSQSDRKLQVPSDTLELTGTGRDVPIFLERDVIDFKCVAVDHTYREKLIIRNGGKTAMKVSVTDRHDISDYIEFSPDFGFVQAGQAFPITILFKPKASLLRQCARFLTDPDGGQIEVPFKVVVPDQKLPVSFTVCAHVTTTDLIFSPRELNFGPCVLAEDTGVVLRVTNPSALPQTFGFVNLPSAIHITPNDGFGHILPGEEVERIVSFQPPIPGPQSLAITVKTLAGRSFTLPITATGVQPSLSLSHNKIQFPATPLNDVRSCSVTLRNHTSSTQAFEFGVPSGTGLVFIPHVGDVPPNGSKRIQINFQPVPEEQGPAASQQYQGSNTQQTNTLTQQPIDDTSKAQAGPGSPAGKAKTGGAQAKGGAQAVNTQEADDPTEGEGYIEEGYDGADGPSDDPNSWYAWHNYSVPCFIRPPLSGTSGGGGGSTSRPVSSSGVAPAAPAPQGDPQVLHLNIVTCAVQPDLVLRTDLPWVPTRRCYELDFGPVPVGQRVTRPIELLNQGQESIPLNQAPLDHHQYFNVVAAWRTLAPGGRCRCLIAFQPQERSDYKQVLTIISPRTHVRICLKGQGIAPQLQLDPPSVLTAGLDLGDVAKGESSEAKFSVTNVCPFPLSWCAKFKGLRDPNLENRAPFFCRPAEGTLAQGQSCEVVVVFRPSQQRPYYLDTLQVSVPNQQEQLNIPLKGRGWEEGLYLAGPEYPNPSEDPLLERTLADMANTALASTSSQQTGSAPTTPPTGSRQATPQDPNSTASRTNATQAASLSVPFSVPTPARIGPPGSPSPLTQPPLGITPMAPCQQGPRVLTATFPHPLYLGETATYTLEVGSLKSAAYGSAAGELTLDGLTPVHTKAGWGVDTLKVAVPAGDRKTVTLSYKAPTEPNAGMASLFGHSEYIELPLSATVTGGSPAPPGGQPRRFTVVARVLLHPKTRPPTVPLPTGYRSAAQNAEAPPPDKKAGKK